MIPCTCTDTNSCLIVTYIFSNIYFLCRKILSKSTVFQLDSMYVYFFITNTGDYSSKVIFSWEVSRMLRHWRGRRGSCGVGVAVTVVREGAVVLVRDPALVGQLVTVPGIIMMMIMMMMMMMMRSYMWLLYPLSSTPSSVTTPASATRMAAVSSRAHSSSRARAVLFSTVFTISIECVSIIGGWHSGQ